MYSQGIAQETVPRREYIFENHLLPSRVISRATPYHSQQSFDHQRKWNTQRQHNTYSSAQSGSQPSYSDSQQSAYACQQPYAHSTYPQAYTLEQHYKTSLCNNSHHHFSQYSANSCYPHHSQSLQSGYAHNDYYTHPPIVVKISRFSCLSGALDEPVPQHSRSSYSRSSYSSLVTNIVYSRGDQQTSSPQEAQYQSNNETHGGDSTNYFPQEPSASSAHKFPLPSYPQTDYNIQESDYFSCSTEMGTPFDKYVDQPQSMADCPIHLNHQSDLATTQSYHYIPQTSAQLSNQMSTYSYQEPAGGSQAAYTSIPQPMLPPSQTGPTLQSEIPPAIFHTQEGATTRPSVEDSLSASVTASPTITVHSD
ncbi:hypothetical protein FRC03_011690 [Tulasnella sp. 419]|nr:hypothetical protein FRC03_011690 [Tulasnella sp. 419]